MVQLSRDLDCQYKTAFVLARKLFEAIAQEIHTGEVLEGHIGIDGACFSGHIRPENAKKERKHRRLSIHQTGMGRLRPIGCRHRRFCLIRGVGPREHPIRKVSELIDFCGVKLPSFAMWKGRIRNLRKSVLVGIVFAKALVV